MNAIMIENKKRTIGIAEYMSVCFMRLGLRVKKMPVILLPGRPIRPLMIYWYAIFFFKFF